MIMTSELILGVRIDPQTLTTIKLNDVNFKTKVEDLRCETAERVNLSKDLLELIYCGCILEDNSTLESYGLKTGSMVHVLKKKDSEIRKSKYISEESMIRVLCAFKSFKDDLALRSALRRLAGRPEVIDNIIASTPGLHDDTVAIAILQSNDLLTYFTDFKTVRRLAEAHPLLVEAAQNIAAAVREEAHNNATASTNNSVSNSQPTANSYSLDNLSDDEEMAGDSSQSSDSNQPPNLSISQSNTMITAAAELEAEVSRMRARTFPLTNSPSSTSAGSTTTGVITTEMFNQAMQQASAATGLINDYTLPPMLPPVISPLTNLQSQLAQMHEMGLQDDTLNIQALQFTNGDVQAAIEIVFSGFSNN